MITLKQINYTLSVSRNLHFKKAADECSVSPSTLSNAVTEMENQLGYEIFERDNKRVLKTELGKIFLESAQSIKLQIDELEKLAHLKKEPLSHSLSLGIIPTIGPYLLPVVLPAIKKEYPLLNLTIIEGQSEVLVDKVKRGEIDTAILALPFELDGLLPFKFWEEDFFWISHKESKHALKKEISAKELEESELMLLEEGHCLKDQALEACKLSSNSNLNITASSLTTLIQLVAGKMGSTLVPEMALEQLLANNKLLSKAHLKETGPHREIALIIRSTYNGLRDIELLKELFSKELKKKFK